jgi:hypothetical protein
MNNYCVDLNLKLDPLRPDVDINSFPATPWQLLSLDLMNPEVITLFNSLDLDLRIAGLFVLTENMAGPIHVDGIKIGHVPKINWAYGNNHVMNWYQVKDTTVEKTHKVKYSNDKSIEERTYLTYLPKEVECIHRQPVGFPSIIQAGIPHNVQNFNGIRRCVTIALIDKCNQRITMEKAVELFSQYI